MKQITLTKLLLACLSLSLVFMGCSTKAGNLRPTDITLEGVVAKIDDQTPVDGGVTIELRLDDGSGETLLFGSLFTYPPPTEERLKLYQRIQAIAVGYRVRAVGERMETGGIALTDIFRLYNDE
ncbi:MAG: hypothetical protein HKN21_17495 [Candidatus Eisenbacteria bacterium]|uniref:Uncharacterized protein n=1 Tax=Eiseniibacteriota bacterium TaxID=2212470 RepID=A0A7Y2ECL7_UNCEI|nr:hypothetical protein [Candidatus Eisenbacteria bacterium]